MNLTYISDYLPHERDGGAEACDGAILERIGGEFNISYRNRNTLLSINDIPDDSFLFLSDFTFLDPSILNHILTKDYVIIEHDWKLENNRFQLRALGGKSFAVSQEDLCYLPLFANAKFVFCQSVFQKVILMTNMPLNNYIDFDGNVWSESDIALMKKVKEETKDQKKFGVAIQGGRDQLHRHIKGTDQAIEACLKNKKNHFVIPPCSREEFYRELAGAEEILLFPNWPESFSRVYAEALYFGCQPHCNGWVGARYTSWKLYEFLLASGHDKEDVSNQVMDRIEKLSGYICDSIVSFIKG